MKRATVLISLGWFVVLGVGALAMGATLGFAI